MTRRLAPARGLAEVQLGRQRSPQHAEGPHMTPYLRAANVKDGELDLSDVKEMNFDPDEQQIFRLQPGDVLVSEGAGSLAAVGTSAVYDDDPPGVCFQNTLLRLRPRADADPGFVAWWARAMYASGEFARFATGASIYHLGAERVRAMRAWIPAIDRQRRIAAFLDAETDRIDQLVATKRRMIEVVKELDAGRTQNAVCAYGVRFPLDGSRDGIEVPDGWRVTTLVRCLRQLTNGYVGPTRDVLVDDGVRYIQSVHIKSGRIDFDRRPFYVPEEWHNARPRIHLREGDVLLVQTGDIGQVAVVPGNFGPASCHALQILRVEPGTVSGEFLGLYLRTPFGKNSLLARATGALHPHLEGGIRDVPVVVPPPTIQDELVADARLATATATETEEALTRQIDLLHEHRRSLIAAVVAGEMEVP